MVNSCRVTNYEPHNKAATRVDEEEALDDMDNLTPNEVIVPGASLTMHAAH